MLEDVILRWSIGNQNTTQLSEFDDAAFLKSIFLAKLSILSFQHYFSGAQFYILYNGTDFEDFKTVFNSSEPQLIHDVIFVDQCQLHSPYPFFPIGVWWKWIPFRLNISKHEIAIDTDIICIDHPQSWYEWLKSDIPIIVAPERFEKVKVSTCGDFYNHPLLKDKTPANCGIVGQRAGFDFSDRFFEIAGEVRYGHTRDSMFITEQGAINLWIYSLEMEGIQHQILDFELNSWVRDFIYHLNKGIKVETIHAVSWHKEIVIALKDLFLRKIKDNTYTNNDFINEIVASKALNSVQSRVIYNQLGINCGSTEYFC